MSDMKLKLSEIKPVRYWMWVCPNCEYYNETDLDPNFFEGFDEEMGDYFECVGCYELFDLDKGE